MVSYVLDDKNLPHLQCREAAETLSTALKMAPLLSQKTTNSVVIEMFVGRESSGVRRA